MIWPLSICMLSLIVLFLMSVFLLNMGFYFIMNDLVYFIEWEILSLNSNSIVMTLLFDWMSLIFMGFVLFISSLVIFYSDEYMEDDLTINRFIILVLMFVLSMMFLIISPNLISILLGWDGLGLLSYCLVIYYQNVKSYNAGMLTALSNRIGDVALLMSIAWMLNFGGWNYIYYLDVMKNSFEMKLIGILFIISEVFFFLSFFWAFFHSSLSPAIELGVLWPPTGIMPFNPLQIPLLNTAILLASGVTVTWAHHSLMENNYTQSTQGLFFTVILGIYFTILQAYEYIEAPLTIADAVYGSTFFVATGFHGLHVIIGTSFLLVCLLRHIFFHFSSIHHFGFEAAAWYWHFVDVVWLFLYISIYWWGS